MTTFRKQTVPWFTRSELISVYDELFSGNPVLQKHALGRLSVWKCRLLHRLAVAIECTGELILACLQDEEISKYTDNEEKIDHVRLTYSMAIVRFVNLLTETQQKKLFAVPIHSIAEQLGIPDWIVDLRHNAAHSGLPSLTLLRSGADFAVHWLKENYWNEQIFAERNVGRHEDVNQEPPDWIERPKSAKLEPDDIVEMRIFSALNKYVHLHLSKPPKRKLQQEVKQVMSKIDTKKWHKHILIKCLLQEGHLLASKSQLESMGVNIEDLLNRTDDVSLPEQLNIWDPVIAKLQNRLEDLLFALCSENYRRNDLNDRLIAAWICHIFKQCLATESQPWDSIKRYDVDKRKLIERIIKHPSRWTQQLLKVIFFSCDTGLKDSQQQQILKSVQSRLKTCISSGEKMISDENCTQHSADGQEQEEHSGLRNPWSLAPEDLEWSKWPLGTCPGQYITYTNLELRRTHSDNYLKAETENEEEDMDDGDTATHEHVLEEKWDESEEDVENELSGDMDGTETDERNSKAFQFGSNNERQQISYLNYRIIDKIAKGIRLY